MRILSLPLTLTALTAAAPALAVPFAPFDVRAAGMGGTGVASAQAASAALFNPAMLSAQKEGEHFQFVLGAGATAADEDEMLDQVDAFQTTLDGLNQLINVDLSGVTLNVGIPYAPGTQQYDLLTQVSSSTLTTISQLNAFNNANLIAGLGAGLGFGVPSKTVGVGVFATSTVNVIATPQIAAADTALLADYATALSDGAISATEYAQHSQIFSELTPGSVTIQDVHPLSTVNGLAVGLAEYGVGFSHRYELASGAQLSLGIAPKAVTVVTYDYTAGVENFDDADIDQKEKTEETFDVDIGVVFRASAESPWQFGLAARHLVGGDFVTSPNTYVDGNGNLVTMPAQTVSVKPQLRGGVARMTKRSTLALDVDLLENDGIRAGSETRFLGLGAEYDLTFLQLRAGYRANLADSDVSDVATVGLGLGPVDIGAMASDSMLGAYLQLGFGW